MREINLENYKIKDREGQEVDYPVKDVLLDMLYHPELKLNGRGILERNDLAKNLVDCKEKVLLLEEGDYVKLKQAFEIITGFSKNDVELVKRVLNAQEVEVKKK